MPSTLSDLSGINFYQLFNFAQLPLKGPGVPKYDSTGECPKIFRYSDFRHYLEDYIRFAKNKNPRFSYRAFAKKASLSSPNYLQTILQGKRRVGGKVMLGLTTALDLDELEAQYFKNLIYLAQAKTEAEASAYRNELQRLCPHAEKQVLNENAEHYLGHWIYPLLREVAQLPGFSPDPYWLTNRLLTDLPTSLIQEAMTFLLSQGYLVKAEQGYQARSLHITTNDDVLSKLVQRYHCSILDEAKQMIGQVPIDAREFRAITFKAPRSILPELRQRIRAFRDELLDVVSQSLKEEEADNVVQLNIQMYPTLKVK